MTQFIRSVRGSRSPTTPYVKGIAGRPSWTTWMVCGGMKAWRALVALGSWVAKNSGIAAIAVIRITTHRLTSANLCLRKRHQVSFQAGAT